MWTLQIVAGLPRAAAPVDRAPGVVEGSRAVAAWVASRPGAEAPACRVLVESRLGAGVRGVVVLDGEVVAGPLLAARTAAPRRGVPVRGYLAKEEARQDVPAPGSRAEVEVRRDGRAGRSRPRDLGRRYSSRSSAGQLSDDGGEVVHGMFEDGEVGDAQLLTYPGEVVDERCLVANEEVGRGEQVGGIEPEVTPAVD